MKTQKSILMTILLGLVITLYSHASEGEATHEAEYDLKNDITHLFKKVPWEDIVDPTGCCVVMISFRINDELGLDEIQVEGENEDLVYYTKVVLNRNRVNADEVLKGRKFKLQIKFLNKA